MRGRPRVFNKYRIHNDVARVMVRNREGIPFIVLIDSEDAYLLATWTLSVRIDSKSGRLDVHAQNTGKNRKNTLLSRVIMNAPAGVEVDHIFHQTLDNRKSQLRLVTHAQNMQNKLAQSNGSSGVRGVSWHSQMGKWRGTVHINRKQISLGLFDTVAEAEEVVKSFRASNMPFSSEAFELNKTGSV